MKNFSVIFKDFQIGNVSFKNRLFVAPMTRTSANDNGTVSEIMKEYYPLYAKGGFSGIITEGTYPDLKYSQAYENQPGIATEEQALSWKPIIEAVHNLDSKIILQIQHGGALVQYNQYTNETIAPSAIKPKGEKLKAHGGSGPYKIPNEIDKNEIYEIIESFANAALRAKKVGFDGVEIHGANGYIIDQFITDYTNKRTDEFGGGPENRSRIALLILKAIREKVGNDFIVGIRLSQGKVNDFEHKWKGEIEVQQIITEILKGNPDYIHTTEFKAYEPAFLDNNESFAHLVKKYSNKPVVANGGLDKPDVINKMINNNEMDIASLGTSALANKDWPNRVFNNMPIKGFDSSSFRPKADITKNEVEIEIYE